MYYGGGLELMRDLFKKVGVYPIPCGNVGVQMGGFYRKEINSVDDLKGLKFRIGGLGGMILSKLGVVPQQIATADIYPSLERGTIDARRVDRPVRRREARPAQGRELLLHPRLVGGQRAGHARSSTCAPMRRCPRSTAPCWRRPAPSRPC